MSRHVYELVRLLMQIEENFSRMYNNIACLDGSYAPQIKTVAKVLSRQESNHAQKYNDLLTSANLAEIQISEEIFEKTMIMLKSFKRKIKLERMHDIGELLEYAVQFEKENANALTEILQSLDEQESAFKTLLEQLVKAEEEHIQMLSAFIK